MSRTKSPSMRSAKSGAKRSSRTAARAGGSRAKSKSSRGSRSGRSAKSRRSASRSSGSSRSSRSRTSASRTRSQGQVTIDHDEIREWVEARGGNPTTVEGTGRGRDVAGVLRIDFPGYSGKDTLVPIDWDEFFEKFEEEKLAFLHDNKPGSRFSKLIQRGKRRF